MSPAGAGCCSTRRITPGPAHPQVLHSRVPAGGGTLPTQRGAKPFVPGTANRNTAQVQSAAQSDATNCFQSRTPPEYAAHLRDAGFELLNQANNHGYDYGPQGYRNTQRALEQHGLKYTGAPDQITAVEVEGVKVAVLGFSSYVWSNSLIDIESAKKVVEKAATVADAVVVQVHMGAEGAEELMVRWSGRLLDASIEVGALASLELGLPEDALAFLESSRALTLTEHLSRQAPRLDENAVGQRIPEELGIGTVKGVEIGAGFHAARLKGSQCNDPIGPGGFRTNRAGGVLAGITTGQEIVIRAACKPIPSIALEQETIDTGGNSKTISVRGRHDACVIPRVIPVCEAMVCLVLADHLLRQKAVR